MNFKIITVMENDYSIVVRIEETTTGYHYYGHYAIFGWSDIQAETTAKCAVYDMITDMRNYAGIFEIFCVTMNGNKVVELIDTVANNICEEFKLRNNIRKEYFDSTKGDLK